MIIVSVPLGPTGPIHKNLMKDKYKNNYGLRGVSDREFIAIAKALFTSKGFEIKDRFQFRINSIKKEKRNVVLRIKLIDDIVFL
jgi:hypothetical protein